MAPDEAIAPSHAERVADAIALLRNRGMRVSLRTIQAAVLEIHKTPIAIDTIYADPDAHEEYLKGRTTGPRRSSMPRHRAIQEIKQLDEPRAVNRAYRLQRVSKWALIGSLLKAERELVHASAAVSALQARVLELETQVHLLQKRINSEAQSRPSKRKAD